MHILFLLLFFHRKFTSIIKKLVNVFIRFNHAFESNPNWASTSPHLCNNVAVCAVREAYNHAASVAGYASSHLPIGDALHYHQKAETCLQTAAEIVNEKVRSSVYETVSESRDSVLSNVIKLKQWQEHGGNFEGAIMW